GKCLFISQCPASCGTARGALAGLSMMKELVSWNFYEITLLALTIYREARGEPHEAQIAVAHTVKNRISKPGWWGTDIVSVLTKKWQYSSLTDPNDTQLTTWPK